MLEYLLAACITTTCVRCHHEPISLRVRQPSVVLTKIIHEMAPKVKFKTSTKEVQAVVAIAYKESTFRPTARAAISRRTRRPISTAYGLFGFLDSTWGIYGYKKTSCPWCQTEVALLRIRKRYGTAQNALRFHKANGYY